MSGARAETGRGARLVGAVLLCIIAGAAQLGSFAVLAARVPDGAVPSRWWAASLGLLALSFLLPTLSRRARRHLGWRAAAAVSLGIQVVLLVFLARVGAVGVMIGFALVLQGLLLSRAADPAPAALVLALSAVQALLALSAEPGAFTLLAFLVAAGLSSPAAVMLHAERARGRVLGSRRTVDPPRASGRDLALRLRYALALSAAGALPAIGLLAVFSLVARIGWVELLASESEGEQGPAADLDLPDERFWSGHMGFGGADGRDSNDPVAWVRLRAGDTGELVRDGRPLWLKAMTPDTFTDDGLHQLEVAELELHTDAGDGRSDGWIRLADPPSEPVLEVEVQQAPLRVVGAGGDVLLYGEPPLAVELPRLRYHPGRAMVSARHNTDWFAYRVRTTARGLSARRSDGSALSAAHGDPRYVQLPDSASHASALARIDREARAMVRGARTDDERVRAIVAAFRERFDYSLEGTGFTGLASVVAFLDRREGYCTSFAQAAVLMLRGLGIPTRGVVGYLATEWDDEQADYIVRVRHAHAWIEVHFVDRGWVAFDPTPSARRASLLALAAAQGEGPRGLGSWGAQLAGDVRDLALARGDAGSGDVLRTLAAVPEVLLASARRFPLAPALGLFALLVWSALRVLRPRLRPGPLGVPIPTRARAESFWDRLLLALEAHGFHKRRAQTPREFAHGVIALGGPTFEPLSHAAEMLYRARWGGREPTPEERAALSRFLRELRGGWAATGS